MNNRHATERAQAVLETALVIPIMLALVFNFLGLMVLVQGQNQLHSALSLAAQSITVYPAGADKAICEAAGRAFWPTAYGKPTFLSNAATPSTSGCSWGSDKAPGAAFTIKNLRCRSNTSAPVTGTGVDYFNGQNYLDAANSGAPQVQPYPIQCSADQVWDFSNTVLGPFIVWQPTFKAVAQVQPPATRQCAGSEANQCS